MGSGDAEHSIVGRGWRRGGACPPGLGRPHRLGSALAHAVRQAGAGPAPGLAAQDHRDRVQTDAMGHLDAGCAKLLDQLGRSEIDRIPLPERRRVKPGTELIREWAGKLERVMVLEQGFAWNGAVYDSLSAVARAITGTSWNGPRFFGLRDRKGSS